MIREKQQREIVIDLTGPEGNAYCLLAYAEKFGTQLDLEVAPILADMKSGDYEHLLQVFDSHFGHFVILER